MNALTVPLLQPPKLEEVFKSHLVNYAYSGCTKLSMMCISVQFFTSVDLMISLSYKNLYGINYRTHGSMNVTTFQAFLLYMDV